MTIKKRDESAPWNKGMGNRNRVKVVDNEYYQEYILRLVKAGHSGLSVLNYLLKLMDEMGEDDLFQNAKDMSEQELIRIAGMNEAYGNVHDLIDFIAVTMGYK